MLPSVDLTVNGAVMRCHIGDNHTEAMLLIGGKGTGEEELVRFLGKVKPGDIVVDLGANSGLYSVLAAQAVGPTGRVIAIEPNRTLVDRLKFNVAANHFEDIVSVAICAVGEERATRTLNVCLNNMGASSLCEFKVYGETEQVKVPVVTLLQVLEDMKVERIDAMKIDIEGYEDRALMPFLDTAPKTLWPKVILIETLHTEAWTYDCVFTLKDLGYREIWQGKCDCMLELA